MKATVCDECKKYIETNPRVFNAKFRIGGQSISVQIKTKKDYCVDCVNILLETVLIENHKPKPTRTASAKPAEPVEQKPDPFLGPPDGI